MWQMFGNGDGQTDGLRVPEQLLVLCIDVQKLKITLEQNLRWIYNGTTKIRTVNELNLSIKIKTI